MKLLSRLSSSRTFVSFRWDWGGCHGTGSSHTEPEELRLEPNRVCDVFLFLRQVSEFRRSHGAIRGAKGHSTPMRTMPELMASER